MPRIGIDARKIGDGGIGRYVRALLAGVPESLPQAEVVALAFEAARAEVAAVAPGVRMVPVRAAGYSLAEHLELARVASRERLALLHVPHYVVPAAARCPIVATIHDLVHLRPPRPLAHRIYARAMLGLARRRARLVLTAAEAVADELVADAGFDRGRICVVPHGVSAGFLEAGAPPADQVESFIAHRGLRRPYVVNVTNGLPHKGLDVLLAAMARVPGVELALVGEELGRREVRDQLAQAELSVTPRLLGRLSDADLRLAYAGAAAVVVPSRFEGFGLPALEALAVGALVVATRAGGLPEALGDAAVLVPVDSVACLAAALYRAGFELPREEREAIARRGLAQASRFPWARSIRATCAAYERALAGSA